MSYKSVAEIQQNNDLRMRITACVAVEQLDSNPWGWADLHSWQLAAFSGWAEAWDLAAEANALEPSPTFEPGNDEDIITDAMILAAVMALYLEENPPEEEQNQNSSIPPEIVAAIDEQHA